MVETPIIIQIVRKNRHIMIVMDVTFDKADLKGLRLTIKNVDELFRIASIWNIIELAIEGYGVPLIQPIDDEDIKTGTMRISTDVH